MSREDNFRVNLTLRIRENIGRIGAPYCYRFERSVDGELSGRLSVDLDLDRLLIEALKAAAAREGRTPDLYQRLEDRPSARAAVVRAWPELMGQTRMDTMDALVTDLLGRDAVHRTHRATTRYARDGTRSVFPPADQAAGWLDRIERVEQTNPHPFAMACFAYAQTVLSHPYQDGNGRLARAMYQRSLGRSSLLAGPMLPLGPLVYASHRVHDRALQHLGMTGDWDPFVEVMLGLTRKAAAFTRHVLSTQTASAPSG